MATAQITAEALMWCATKSRFTLTQHILVQRVRAVTSKLSNLLVKNDNSVSNNKTEDNKQEIYPRDCLLLSPSSLSCDPMCNS